MLMLCEHDLCIEKGDRVGGVSPESVAAWRWRKLAFADAMFLCVKYFPYGVIGSLSRRFEFQTWLYYLLAVGLTVTTERCMLELPSNSLNFGAGAQKKKPWLGLS